MTEPTEQELALFGDMKVPDLVGKIIGFRCFTAGNMNPPLVDEWSPGVNTARCRQSPNPFLQLGGMAVVEERHIAPSLDCHCGLYAFSHPKHLMSYYGDIIAVVRGWGKMCVAENGWRAQYAEIIAFSGEDSDLLRLAELFNVPIVPQDKLREWAEKQEGTLLPKSLSVDKLAKAPAKMLEAFQPTSVATRHVVHHSVSHAIRAWLIMAVITSTLVTILLLGGFVTVGIVVIMALVISGHVWLANRGW